MPVDSALLDAMIYRQPGAVNQALDANYYNPTVGQRPTQFNQQYQTGGRGPQGVYVPGFGGFAGSQQPTDAGNAANLRGQMLGQDLRFLGSPQLSALLSGLTRPIGGIGFQGIGPSGNVFSSAGYGPTTPPAHA